MTIGVLNEVMDIYNTAVAKEKQMDTNGIDRSADVRERKLEVFMAKFDNGCKIQDLKSKKMILKDRNSLRTRYLTTFRESGVDLRGRVNLRILFTVPEKDSVAFGLDYESHSNLITPAGKVLDGSTGLNGPRSLDLAVLYLIKNEKICNMWLSPDLSGVCKQPQMPLGEIQKTPEYIGFTAIVEEHLGSANPKPMFTTRFICGDHEMKGRRPTMEDKTVICDCPDGAGRDAKFIGVYDGHGGKGAAAFVAENLHINLQVSPAWRQWDVKTALKEAFKQTDKDLLETEEPSGTCAVVAVLHESRLYVAHAGDCRAVLCSGEKWEATRLTEDHKPDRPDEKARILASGGEVVDQGCWRVTSKNLNVMMATSRAIGDRAFKTGKHEDEPLIISDPEIMSRDLSSSDHFLITACDGVWDVLSDQEACDVVREQCQKNQHTGADALARQLVQAAYDRGSGDNISAAVSMCRF